jgi:hypothetical protein
MKNGASPENKCELQTQRTLTFRTHIAVSSHLDTTFIWGSNIYKYSYEYMIETIYIYIIEKIVLYIGFDLEKRRSTRINKMTQDSDRESKIAFIIMIYSEETRWSFKVASFKELKRSRLYIKKRRLYSRWIVETSSRAIALNIYGNESLDER